MASAVQSFTQPAGENQRLLAQRLSPSDVSTLRLLFGGLESMVGLGSNFGAMIDRMKAAEVVTCKHPARLHPREQCQTCGRKAACSGCGECTACGELPWGPHVHETIGSAVSGELEPAELWACWTNHNDSSMGLAVREAYGALLRMLEHGGSDYVRHLFRMYGGAMPARLYSDYSKLGDLVPLATETDAVIDHADKMSSKTGHPVTDYEALVDYLSLQKSKDRVEMQRRLRVQTERVAEVNGEAHRMLIAASNAFRKARDER
jgi:hypothetical protein